MLVLNFVFQLAGATMMLLFAVRLVRTGVERAFGSSFQRLLTYPRNPLQLSLIGLLMAVILQSSAAVTLLVAGFAGAGSIAFLPGMAIVIGGDLGSALLIQVLSLRIDWLVPVLLTIGGYLFLKTHRRGLKHSGRVLLGVAFILLALGLLRQAVQPIQESAFLPGLTEYLSRDFLTAFILGAVLAFVMHSSVAAILMIITIVGTGAIPVDIGVSVVLGANSGSALIPIWLARGMAPEGQRIPIANLMLRGTGSLIATICFNTVIPIESLFSISNPGQALVYVHIAFNALLLLVIPFVGIFHEPTKLLAPDAKAKDNHSPANHRSVLLQADLANPSLALAGLRREVLRMTSIVADMLDPVMEYYEKFDEERIKYSRDLDRYVNEAFDAIRHYSSEIDQSEMSREQRRDLYALVDYAIALEAAGDVVAKRLLAIATEKHKIGLSFSAEGFTELINMHAHVRESLEVASNVLVSSDLSSARLLLQKKSEMSRMERQSRKKHLARLRRGEPDSLNSSDTHLETAYSLKELNSWIVTVAHPILMEAGQLLETRLTKSNENDNDPNTR